MNTIWRCNLQTTERQFVMLPKGSEILSVQVDKHPFLSVNVPSNHSVRPTWIGMYRAGDRLPDERMRLIGSCQAFHVFELNR